MPIPQGFVSWRRRYAECDGVSAFDRNQIRLNALDWRPVFGAKLMGASRIWGGNILRGSSLQQWLQLLSGSWRDSGQAREAWPNRESL